MKGTGTMGRLRNSDQIATRSGRDGSVKARHDADPSLQGDPSPSRRSVEKKKRNVLTGSQALLEILSAPLPR
jgi:hypothetical protein